MGKLAPGPDYKLYLSPEFVETESDFNRLKPQMAIVADVKTFDNFLVKIRPILTHPDTRASLYGAKPLVSLLLLPNTKLIISVRVKFKTPPYF